MSRVFDALRRAESESGKKVPEIADSFFDSHAVPREDLKVSTENIQIAAEDRIFVHTSPHGMGGERFRQLKSHLLELRSAGTLRTILVASPSAQDGKSTVALNLATVLSEKGKSRVLLLEADLRRPSIATKLRLKPGPGLTNYLSGKCSAMAAMRKIDPLEIYVLCAGEASDAPLELLQSSRYSDLLVSLATQFDWIIIDAPPVVPVPDTMVLRKLVDATLLVARAGQTTGESLDDTIKQFQGSPVLGILLNCAEKLDGRYSKYYGRKEKKQGHD
jgi:capsular exopolysaccharide synthesis family protein